MATQVEVPKEEQPNPRKFSRTVEVPGGNPQVFYGATEQEVTDKMADSIKNGTLKIRELSRKTNLETQTFTAPEGADPFEDIPEPKVRQLTPEERADIAAKMTKPETVVEAYRTLYEAETGLQPTQAGKLQVQQARDAAQVKALNAARTFMEAHPEFVPCTENRDALDQFFRTRKIGPTIKNFELAFKELSANGLLVLRTEEAEPERQETPRARIEQEESMPDGSKNMKPEAEVAMMNPEQLKAYYQSIGQWNEGRREAESTRIESEPAQPVIPSALTRRSASGGGTPAKRKEPTAAEYAMFNADQIKAYHIAKGDWGKR